MDDKQTTGTPTTEITRTPVFKSACKDMALELKMALADASQKISERPISGYKPAGANCSRIFVKSIRKHAQVIILYTYFDDIDHAFLLDAHFFYGDPVELRAEVDWLASELISYEKQMGVELLVQLQGFDENE